MKKQITSSQDPIIRKSNSMPKSLWDKVDQYHHANKLASENEAIRQLIQIGLRGKR